MCLVTRHPNSQLGKLTRTEFVVLDARTGTIERTIKIDPKAAAHVGSPSNPHAPFTTAFKYDFLLTDLFIISGGPGGGLFVWDYIASDAGLLYRVPGPWVLGSLPELPRQYSNITMSSDGRFIAATTSNQLLMFDLVNKTLCGAYSNGRRVKAQYQYVSNPSDDFAGGIWCLMRDWTGVRDEASGAVSWKETESSSRNGGVVAYVTALPDECTAKVRYASMHQAFSVLPTMLDFCRRPGAFVVVLVGVIIGIVLRQWGSGEQRGSGYKVLHVQ